MTDEPTVSGLERDRKSDRGEVGSDPASRLFAEVFQVRGTSGEARADGGRRDSPGHADGRFCHQDLVRTSRGERRNHDRLNRIVAEGRELFGFRLRHQLGRGAFASVYLAEQRDLAGRLVVLKISASEGTEHQTLARLQHTNIVPIFSVHEDPEAGVRAVCMPYFGGATLSSLLEKLWEGQPRPTEGSQLAQALEEIGSRSRPEGDDHGPTQAGAEPPRDEPREPAALPSGVG